MLLVVGALAGVKYLQIRTMSKAGSSRTTPPETVSAVKVQAVSWGSSLSATASLDAVQGVTVAAELSGKVNKIAFNPGALVNKDALLVQLDTAGEEAQLREVETNMDLARITRERMAILVGKGMVAQADFDKAEADLQQLMAQADNIRAAIAKKTIRAPFAGRLGIRLINLGEVVQEGDAIVSLQILDPIFVNFQLPQQELARISTGLTVALSGEALDERQIRGKITTISPEIDTVTRNVLVQATVANHEEVLRPGMFVNLSIILPGENRVLTVPATAVHYAPYGDSCFVVEEKKDEKSGAASLVLRQQFVRLGEKRGDFVAIREGLSEAETVVSVGVFKLRNGQAVVIDNSTAPEFKLEPRPENN